MAPLILLLSACGASDPSPWLGSQGDLAPSSRPPGPAAVPALQRCGASQFVACESGMACATKGDVLVAAKPCFDHAADACRALGCGTACDIHDHTPKQVLCSPNPTYSSHMKKCAGYSGWSCPENMRCDVTAAGFDDAEGNCVPDLPNATGSTGGT